MELISPLLREILNRNKLIDTSSCLYCQNKIYKAYILHAKDLASYEDTCVFYGLLLCKRCADESQVESKPHIVFDYINFDEEEILLKLKKFGLLL